MTLNAVHNLAFILVSMSRPVDAEPLAREALDKRARLLGPLHPDTIASLLMVGTVCEQQGRYSDAAPMFDEFLARCEKVHGEKHPQTILALAELGRLKYRAGDLPSAEKMLRSALERGRVAQGEDHPETLQSLNDLAFVLQVQGKIGQAEPLFRESLESRQRTLGPDHPDTIQSMGNLAGLLNALGAAHAEEAQRIAEDAVARSRRVNGDHHAATLGFMNLLGNICFARGDLPHAVEVFHQLYDLLPAAQINPADMALYTASYGLALNKAERCEEAIQPLTLAQQRCVAVAPGSNLHRRVLNALVHACEATSRTDQAAQWRAALDKLGPSSVPSTAPSTAPSTTEPATRPN